MKLVSSDFNKLYIWRFESFMIRHFITGWTEPVVPVLSSGPRILSEKEITTVFRNVGKLPLNNRMSLPSRIGIFSSTTVRRLATKSTVGDRIPLGLIFSSSFQAGSAAHPPSYYTLDTGSFPDVKLPRGSVNYILHLAPRLTKKYNCISTTPLCLYGMS
jgi:hypothetical protein